MNHSIILPLIHTRVKQTGPTPSTAEARSDLVRDLKGSRSHVGTDDAWNKHDHAALSIKMSHGRSVSCIAWCFVHSISTTNGLISQYLHWRYSLPTSSWCSIKQQQQQKKQDQWAFAFSKRDDGPIYTQLGFVLYKRNPRVWKLFLKLVRLQ